MVSLGDGAPARGDRAGDRHPATAGAPKPSRAAGRSTAGGLGERIAAVRNEVFDLVAELRCGDDSGERQLALDLMQSIANQLGSVEAAIRPGDGRSGPFSR